MAGTRSTGDIQAATEIVVGTNPITIRRRVKWGECDPAGIVYMVNYSEYVVSAYEIFMAVLLGEAFVKAKARHRVALPAKAFAIEFYASLRPDDDFLMTIEILDIRAKTFDISVEGAPSSTVICSCRSLHRLPLTLLKGRLHHCPGH